MSKCVKKTKKTKTEKTIKIHIYITIKKGPPFFIVNTHNRINPIKRVVCFLFIEFFFFLFLCILYFYFARKFAYLQGTSKGTSKV